MAESSGHPNYRTAAGYLDKAPVEMHISHKTVTLSIYQYSHVDYFKAEAEDVSQIQSVVLCFVLFTFLKLISNISKISDFI